MDFKQEGAAAVAADLIDLRAKITERAIARKAGL